MTHCPGCVSHGKLEDLKRITVHGDDCPGCPEAEDALFDYKNKLAKLTEEMNAIIRQKWAVDGERDSLKAKVSRMEPVVDAARKYVEAYDLTERTEDDLIKLSYLERNDTSLCDRTTLQLEQYIAEERKAMEILCQSVAAVALGER